MTSHPKHKLSFLNFGSRLINPDTICYIKLRKSYSSGWRVLIKTTAHHNPYIISRRYDTENEAYDRMTLINKYIYLFIKKY